jgi:hypothetical protein
MALFDANDPDLNAKMRAMMGPHAIDGQIGQAISLCWTMLPEEKRNVASLEAEIRRIVERALKNLREDAASFGIPPGTPPPSP